MELLLLFSAFLSALTGAITGTRPPEVRLHQTVVESNVASVSAPRVATAAVRVMVQALPSRVAVAGFGIAPAQAIVALIPLYAERRRE